MEDKILQINYTYLIIINYLHDLSFTPSVI
jgi:hypothetical protein